MRRRVRLRDAEPGGVQPWCWVERTELGVWGAEAGRVGAGVGGGSTRCARALQRTPPARAAACSLRRLRAAITAVSAAVRGWKFPALLQASRGAGPHLTTWAASHTRVTFWLPPPHLAQRPAGLSPFPLSAVRLSSMCGLQGHSLVRKHGCFSFESFVLYLRLLLLFLRAGAGLRQHWVLPSGRRGTLEPPACRASSGLRDIVPSSSLPPPWPSTSSRDTPLAAASQPGPLPRVPYLCHPPQPRLLPLRVPSVRPAQHVQGQTP